MKKMTLALLSSFLLLGVACEGEKWMGCSNDEPHRDFSIQLGTPGETKVENNLPKNENLKVLEDDENIEFITEDGKAKITHSSDKEINEGDILVANAEQQYLTRVKTVIDRSDGSTQAILRQASLQDIVGEESGSLRLESTPVYDLSDIEALRKKAKRHKHREGVTYETDGRGRVIIRDLELFNFNLNGQGRASGGANRILGIKVQNPYEKLSISSGAGGLYRAVVNEAMIEVVPTVRSNAEWRLGRIQDMKTRLDTRVRYRIDVTYEASGEVHLEGLLDMIMPKKVIPIRLPGPPPVYLDIELGIPVGVAIKAEKKGTTRVIFESEYEFYSTLAYDKERGSYTEADRRVLVKDTKIESKEGETTLKAEVFLKPQITTRLYRVLGPYAFAKLFVRGELEWPSITKKDDLFIGARGGVGMEVSEPIFLTSVASYEVDDLFNFDVSFDLDNRGESPVTPKNLSSDIDDGVTIDQIGKEGFVRLLLKERDKNDLRRYQILEGTQTGLLVPADGFFMTGEIYYYPLPGSESESFKVRIFGEDGTHVDREIAIQVTPEVREAVSRDRFGTTTNSYKVASGSPGDFASNVPSHDLGGNQLGVQSSETFGLEATECLNNTQHLVVGELRERWGQNPNCAPYLEYVDSYTKWLADALMKRSDSASMEPGELREELFHSRPEDIYRIAQEFRVEESLIQIFPRNKEDDLGTTSNLLDFTNPLKRQGPLNYGDSLYWTVRTSSQDKEGFKSLFFDFFNLTNMSEYVSMLDPKRKCEPMYQVEPFSDQLMVGFRIITRNCGNLAPLPINVKNMDSFLLKERQGKIVWNQNKKTEGGKTTLEFATPKAELWDLISKEIRPYVSATLYMPIDPQIRSLTLTSDSQRTKENGSHGMSQNHSVWIEMSFYPPKEKGKKRDMEVFIHMEGTTNTFTPSPPSIEKPTEQKRIIQKEDPHGHEHDPIDA